MQNEEDQKDYWPAKTLAYLAAPVIGMLMVISVIMLVCSVIVQQKGHD